MSSQASTNNPKVFQPEPYHIYQMNPKEALLQNSNPTTGSMFCEVLEASDEGIIAKNAFVFASGKHPTRNIFAFYRKELGDVTMILEELGEPPAIQVRKQDWMDKTEEDAFAEIEEKSQDPTTELEEMMLETLLIGIPSK